MSTETPSLRKYLRCKQAGPRRQTGVPYDLKWKDDEARRATEIDAFTAALRHGLAAEGPYLIELVCRREGAALDATVEGAARMR